MTVVIAGTISAQPYQDQLLLSAQCRLTDIIVMVLVVNIYTVLHIVTTQLSKTFCYFHSFCSVQKLV